MMHDVRYAFGFQSGARIHALMDALTATSQVLYCTLHCECCAAVSYDDRPEIVSFCGVAKGELQLA